VTVAPLTCQVRTSRARPGPGIVAMLNAPTMEEPPKRAAATRTPPVKPGS
jgi:hypothetical protein